MSKLRGLSFRTRFIAQLTSLSVPYLTKADQYCTVSVCCQACYAGTCFHVITCVEGHGYVPVPVAAQKELKCWWWTVPDKQCVSGQAARLDLCLVLGQREEVVLLGALHATRPVRRAHVVALHLALILVGLAAHAIPACHTCTAADQASEVTRHASCHDHCEPQSDPQAYPEPTPADTWCATGLLTRQLSEDTAAVKHACL